MGNVNDIIAIICTPSMKCAKDFLYYKHLNPKFFHIASEPHDLYGISNEIPVIFTYYPQNSIMFGKNAELLSFVRESGFKSIRYINY